MRDLFGAVISLLAPPPARKRATRDKPVEEEHHFLLDGAVIPYRLIRRRGRRGISLKIDGMGLTVAASLTAPHGAIESMIAENLPWVRRKLGEWSSRRIEPQRWETGATVPFMGESLTLMIDTGHARAVAERALQHLFVKVKSAAPREVEQAVVAWMKKQALPHFAQRAFLFSRLHGLTPPRVMLSSANGRWGSCNTRREVRLSWRLVKAAPALIDYVICHELAHLRHMNHSTQFWAEVERMCPDYQTLKAELDRHDHRFRAF